MPDDLLSQLAREVMGNPYGRGELKEALLYLLKQVEQDRIEQGYREVERQEMARRRARAP